MLMVLVLLALSFVSLAGAQEMRPASAEAAKLDLDQILTKLEQRNAQRAAELQQFNGKRVYRMQYHGLFKDRDAEMVVKVHFTAPDSKQFTIVSENGSKFVIDLVFKRLLQAEQDATGDKRFADRAWNDNPLYRRLLQAYLVVADRLRGRGVFHDALAQRVKGRGLGEAEQMTHAPVEAVNLPDDHAEMLARRRGLGMPQRDLRRGGGRVGCVQRGAGRALPGLWRYLDQPRVGAARRPSVPQ